MAAVSGISRRKARGGNTRNFPEEDVVVDMNEISRIGVGNGEEESSDEDNETVLLNQSRAKLNSGKIGRAVWKMSDEMIGVSIPRKARTAYVKRPAESQEVVQRQSSTSPVAVSPSSSDTSIRRKPKQLSRSKHQMPKVLKSPSSIREIEIEVAEVLYGLTRQFQVPAKEDLGNLHCKDDLERSNDSSFSHPPASSNGSASHGRDLLVASLPVSTPKRKKPRCNNVEVHSSSSFSFIPKTVDGFQTRVQAHSRTKNEEPLKSENVPNELVKSDASRASDIEEQVAGLREEKKLPAKDPTYDDLTVNPAKSDVKLTSAADRPKEKLCTDLEVAPVKSSKDCKLDFTQVHNSSTSETETERKSDSSKTIVERLTTTGVAQKSEEEPNCRDLINCKSIHAEKFDPSKGDKEKTRSAKKSEPISDKTGGSFPWPMSGTVWPRGLPFGHMSQPALLQSNGPVDVQNQQLRLKHCAIHCYIAHNIFIHQQISRVSPLWSMAGAKASKNPNVIPPNGKASNSVTDSSQRKPPNQVASTNNMPHLPAFYFPTSQPKASGNSSGSHEAQYFLLQNNSFHPRPMGFLNASFYQHPQWQQQFAAMSAHPSPPSSEGFSSNTKWQQIPLQNMKPDTIPQAMAMAYAAANGGHGLNLSFQNLPEVAARNGSASHKGHKDGQEDDSKANTNGGKNYQNAFPRFAFGLVPSSSGPHKTKMMTISPQNHPTTAPHPGQISFEATLAATRISSASGRPSGSSVIDKAQSTAFQSQHRAFPSSQVFFTNAAAVATATAAVATATAAAAGYYVRQDADHRQEPSLVQSHSSTMDAVSLSSSAISMAARCATTSGDASKASVVEGMTSQRQMPAHLFTMGALSLPLPAISMSIRSSRASGDASKANCVKGLTSQCQSHTAPTGAVSLSSSALSTHGRSAATFGDALNANGVKVLTSQSQMPSQPSSAGSISLSSSAVSTAGKSVAASADASKANGVKGLTSPSLLPAAQLSGISLPYLGVPFVHFKPPEQKSTAGK